MKRLEVVPSVTIIILNLIVLNFIITITQHSSSAILVIYFYQLYQTIPSCTIWYCIVFSSASGKLSINDANYQSISTIGRILYNHFLNFDNNQNNYNGNDGDINKYILNNDSTQIYHHWNWHNTTLLFGKVLIIITNIDFLFIPNYTIMYYMVLYKYLLCHIC